MSCLPKLTQLESFGWPLWGLPGTLSAPWTVQDPNMVFERLWCLCLQGTKIQHKQISVTPDRALVTNNRIFSKSTLESQ